MDNTKKFSRRLKRCCTALNNILEEAEEQWPEATLYLAGNHLHLLTGDSHNDNGVSQRDKIVVSAKLYASGGDW